MLLQYHLDDMLIFLGACWIFLLAIGFTAYQANARRPAKDPKKRDYHPMAILLVPFLFPFYYLGLISLFIAGAILYGAFLLVFTILLLTIRKPFLLIWWYKLSTKVGEPLLMIGTYLIMLLPRILRPSRGPRQQTAHALDL
jgi:hypothetical protein